MVQSAVASYDIMTAPDDHGQIYATNPTVSTYPITTAQTAVSLVVTQGTYCASFFLRILRPLFTAGVIARHSRIC